MATARCRVREAEWVQALQSEAPLSMAARIRRYEEWLRSRTREEASCLLH
jgi:hypothetical protein